MVIEKTFRQVASDAKCAEVILSGISVGDGGASLTFKLRSESDVVNGRAYKSICFDANEWALFKETIMRGTIDTNKRVGE